MPRGPRSPPSSRYRVPVLDRALLGTLSGCRGVVLDDEVLGYLDVHLRGKPAYPALTPIAVRKQDKDLVAEWSFTAPTERKLVAADLMLRYGGPGNWRRRFWLTLPAKMEGNACRAELPRSCLPYFIAGTVVEDNGYRHSTPLLEVDPTSLGIPGPLPDVDSFAEWGGFESDWPAYAYWYPKIRTSTDAHAGKCSLKLEPGRFVLPPVAFIAGLPYRLSGHLKAEAATQVTVQLVGRFDAVTRTEQLTVDVKNTWTPFTLDFPTEQAMATDLSLTIISPLESAVLPYDLSFRPIP